MNDTLTVASCLLIGGAVALAVVGYTVIVLSVARVLSYKWHPDGGDE